MSDLTSSIVVVNLISGTTLVDGETDGLVEVEGVNAPLVELETDPLLVVLLQLASANTLDNNKI